MGRSDTPALFWVDTRFGAQATWKGANLYVGWVTAKGARASGWEARVCSIGVMFDARNPITIRLATAVFTFSRDPLQTGNGWGWVTIAGFFDGEVLLSRRESISAGRLKIEIL